MDSLHVTCTRIDPYDAFMARVTEDILSLPGDSSSSLHLLILRDPNLPGKHRYISPIVTGIDLSIAEDRISSSLHSGTLLLVSLPA
jgi:hypothetical protein